MKEQQAIALGITIVLIYLAVIWLIARAQKRFEKRVVLDFDAITKRNQK